MDNRLDEGFLGGSAPKKQVVPHSQLPFVDHEGQPPPDSCTGLLFTFVLPLSPSINVVRASSCVLLALSFIGFVASLTGDNASHSCSPSLCNISCNDYTYKAQYIREGTLDVLDQTCPFPKTSTGWRATLEFFATVLSGGLVYILVKLLFLQWLFFVALTGVGFSVLFFITMCADAHSVVSGSGQCATQFGSSACSSASFSGIVVLDFFSALVWAHFSFLAYRFRQAGAYTQI